MSKETKVFVLHHCYDCPWHRSITIFKDCQIWDSLVLCKHNLLTTPRTPTSSLCVDRIIPTKYDKAGAGFPPWCPLDDRMERDKRGYFGHEVSVPYQEAMLHGKPHGKPVSPPKQRTLEVGP